MAIGGFDYFLRQIELGAVSQANFAIGSSGIQMTFDDLKALVNVLKTNASVKALQLVYGGGSSEYVTGDQVCSQVAELLKVNTHINEITLYSLGITDIGAETLAAALRNNTSVTALDVHENSITDIGVQAFANIFPVNRCLKELEIYRNPVTNVGIQALIDAIQPCDQTLTRVDGLDNAFNLPAVNQNLLDQLSALIVRNRVAQNVPFQEILKEIRNNLAPAVFRFNSGEMIGGDFSNLAMTLLTQVLRNNRSIQTLELVYTGGTTNVATEIAQNVMPFNHHITTYTLYSSSMDDAGAVALATELTNNPCVIELNVGYSSIGILGMQTLAAMLKNNTTLRYLGVYENPGVNDESAQMFIDAMQNNYVINVEFRSQYISLNQTKLAQINTLNQRNAQVKQAIIGLKNNTITILNLSNLGINDVGMQLIIDAMQHNYSLLNYNLDGNNISDDLLNHQFCTMVQQNNDLSVPLLNLRGNNITTLDLGARQKSDPKNTQGACVLGVLDDRAAVLLADALPYATALRTLSLDQNNWIGQIGLIGAQALAPALKESNVTRLALVGQLINGEAMVAFSAGLSESKVQTLLLDTNGITAIDAQVLVSAINHVESPLASLDLSYNNLGEQGGQALVPLLAGGVSPLRSLLVDGNGFVNGSIPLINALGVNNNLYYFSNAGNNMGDAGAVAFADAWATNHVLDHVDVASNNIGEVGMLRLIAAIKARPTDAGMVVRLANNQPLTMGVVNALADLFRSNAGLSSIDLSGMGVDNVMLQILAVALQDNTNINTLYLENELFDDVGAQALIALLQKNVFICRIVLSTTSLSPATLDTIQQLLARNANYPHVVTNQLKILQGQTVTLTPSQLGATSHNSSATINFEVNSVEHGFFRNAMSGLATQQFSMQDVRAGIIQAVSLNDGSAFNSTLVVTSNSVSTSVLLTAIDFTYAPRVSRPIPPITVTVGQPFRFVLPNNTFINPNNRSLNVSVASPLPSGLTFNASTGALFTNKIDTLRNITLPMMAMDMLSGLTAMMNLSIYPQLASSAAADSSSDNNITPLVVLGIITAFLGMLVAVLGYALRRRLDGGPARVDTDDSPRTKSMGLEPRVDEFIFPDSSADPAQSLTAAERVMIANPLYVPTAPPLSRVAAGTAEPVYGDAKQDSYIDVVTTQNDAHYETVSFADNDGKPIAPAYTSYPHVLQDKLVAETAVDAVAPPARDGADGCYGEASTHGPGFFQQAVVPGQQPGSPAANDGKSAALRYANDPF